MGRIIRKEPLGAKTQEKIKEINADISTPKKIIPKEIYEAQKQAKRIIEEAERKAKQIISEAQAYKEEEGRRGYQEGFEKGKAEVTELLLKARQEYANLIQSAETDIVKLALRIAKKIIGREIKINPKTILDIVSQALTTVRQQKEIIIKVNPEDLEYLIKNKDRLLGLLGKAKDIDIRGDHSIKRGGCIIDTEIGIIDAQLDTQLNTIEKILLNK